MITMNAKDETQQIREKICPNGRRARSVLALRKAAIGLEAPANLLDVISRVLKRTGSPNPHDVLPLPWPCLNRMLRNGLIRQELVVLAGRPGTGKTALPGCLAVQTARSGRGMLFISREMGDELLGAHMLAREAEVDNSFYREGAVGHKERERLQHGATTLASLPMAVVEKSTGPLCPCEARRLLRGVKNLRTGTGTAYLKFEKAFCDFRETEPWTQNAGQQEENGL